MSEEGDRAHIARITFLESVDKTLAVGLATHTGWIWRGLDGVQQLHIAYVV